MVRAVFKKLMPRTQIMAVGPLLERQQHQQEPKSISKRDLDLTDQSEQRSF